MKGRDVETFRAATPSHHHATAPLTGLRNHLRLAVCCTVAVAALTGCRHIPGQARLQRYEFKQPHMGTRFTLILYAPDDAQAREAAGAAFARIAALEAMMTDYDPDSELMRLCAQPHGRPVRVSDDLFDALQKARRLARLSDGAFDPTVSPLVRLWRRARRRGELPAPDLLARARAAVGWRKLQLDARNRTVTLAAPHMQLDLGGIGKGYAADQALETLAAHGISRALVAASGDIAVSGPPPGRRGWRVSIGAPAPSADRAGGVAPAPAGSTPPTPEHERPRPEPAAPIVRTLLLKHAAVSTSGDSEQFVEIGGRRYSHIVDPRTGLGLTERLQVTIVARRATDTDSFATAVSILGVERGLALVASQRGMAALILRPADGHNETFESPGFRKVPHVE
jgi:thiamine biosynthesis lipoprotein